MSADAEASLATRALRATRTTRPSARESAEAQAEAAAAKAMPTLLTGRRRILFGWLVTAGLSQAVAAGVAVLALSRGLTARTRGAEVVAVVVLLLIAGVVGWIRSRERVLAEQIGQDYVHEIRLGLVRQVLDGHRSGSLGATLTRASNDLNAVRNWVALGIGPIAAAVPLLLGCTVVLALVDPAVALGVLAPLLVLAAVLWFASRSAYEQSKRVRKERGRLAAHLADTLTATTAIRSAGGGYRELRRVDRRSGRVVRAAIDRARVIGRIRGTATAATGVATATVIGGGMFAGLDATELAAVLTVVGLMSAPVQELGRVVEYRQSFRAARRVLAPALTESAHRVVGLQPESADSGSAFYGQVDLVVRGLRLVEHPDLEIPPLYARAGDRVVVDASDRALGSAVLDAVVGVETPLRGHIRIQGQDLARVDFRERRLLLGFAAQGMRLERTTVSRAVRYRAPDSDRGSVGAVLTRVGLAQRVAALPGGEEARLRSGGHPLTTPDRARLLLARAMFGDPPLLVIDHLDAELGEKGRRRLRELLEDYPGVVLLASDVPDAVMRPTRRWNVG